MAPASGGSRDRRPSPTARTPSSAACVDALRTASATSGEAEGSPAPEAIGISSPGPLDPWAGVVTDAPNLGPEFRGRPARRGGRAVARPAGLPRARHERRRARGDDVRRGARRRRLPLPDRLDRLRRLDRHRGPASCTAPTAWPASSATCRSTSTGRAAAAAASATSRRTAPGARSRARRAQPSSRAAARTSAERAEADGIDGARRGRRRRRRGGGRSRPARRSWSRPARVFAAACVELRERVQPHTDRRRRRDRGAPGRPPVPSGPRGGGDRHVPASRVRASRSSRRSSGGDVSLAGAYPLVRERLGNPAWRPRAADIPAAVA